MGIVRITVTVVLAKVNAGNILIDKKVECKEISISEEYLAEGINILKDKIFNECCFKRKGILSVSHKILGRSENL